MFVEAGGSEGRSHPAIVRSPIATTMEAVTSGSARRIGPASRCSVTPSVTITGKAYEVYLVDELLRPIEPAFG